MNRRTFLVESVAAAAATSSATIIRGASALSSTPQHHIVNIADFAFSPATLSASQGDRVTWINRDIVPHTATANDGSWDTGEIGPGERAVIQLTEGMSAEYFCRFHPSMTAMITDA